MLFRSRSGLCRADVHEGQAGVADAAERHEGLAVVRRRRRAVEDRVERYVLRDEVERRLPLGDLRLALDLDGLVENLLELGVGLCALPMLGTPLRISGSFLTLLGLLDDRPPAGAIQVGADLVLGALPQVFDDVPLGAPH